MTKYMIIIKVLMAIISWYEKASEDEYITDDEIAELVADIAQRVEYKFKV